jgi:putative hydrolase of the HAD superfamily
VNRLIVFDLDDTLFLERDYVRSGFRAVGEYAREKLGLRGFFAAAWRRFCSGERKFIFDRVLEEKGRTAGPRVVRSLLARYRTHAPSIRLCADARRFLSNPPPGVAVAVITDGRVISQRAKVRALGLDRFVRDIVITGRWGPEFAKPHPRAFRFLERKHGLSGGACAYVGDNPVKDFLAPLKLGWKAWRLYRPAGLHAEAPSAGVAEIGSCDDLRKRILADAASGSASIASR